MLSGQTSTASGAGERYVALLPLALATGVLWALIGSVYVYEIWYIAAAVALVVVAALAAKGLIRSEGLARAALPVGAYFTMLGATALWAADPKITLRWVAIDSIELVVFALFFLAVRNTGVSRLLDALFTIPFVAAAMAIVLYLGDPDATRLAIYALPLLPVLVPFVTIRVMRERRPYLPSLVLFLIFAILLLAPSRTLLGVAAISAILAIALFGGTARASLKRVGVIALAALLVLTFALAVGVVPHSDPEQKRSASDVSSGEAEPRERLRASDVAPPGDARAASSWRAVARGDFDADGTVDIIWRESVTGENAVALMREGGRQKVAFLTATTPPWTVSGVGDFDGDGHADLFWRNRATGENAIWFMEGTNRTSYKLTHAVPDQAWQVRAMDDYDDDGDTDLYWHNEKTGQNAIWYLDGAKRTALDTGVSSVLMDLPMAPLRLEPPDFEAARASPRAAPPASVGASKRSEIPTAAKPVTPRGVTRADSPRIRAEASESRGATPSSAERLSRELMADAMPLGIGYMNFTKYSEEALGASRSLDNTFAAWLLEGGVATVAIVLWLILMSIRHARRFARVARLSEERDFAIACLIALGGVLLFGLFHQVHQAPALWMIFALCAACGAEADDRERRERVAPISGADPDLGPTRPTLATPVARSGEVIDASAAATARAGPPRLAFRRHETSFGLGIQRETALAVAVVLVALAALVGSHEHELFPAIAALVTILLGGIAVLEVLRRREPTASPVLEIGGFYAAVIVVYAAYPLAVFIGGGGTYTAYQDNRLYVAQPTASELALLGWWYALYLAAFAIPYLLVTRRTGGLARRPADKPETSLIAVVLLLFLGIHAALLGIRLFFAMSADTYLEGYLVVQQLPLLARQIYAKTSAMLPTLLLFMLTLLFASYERSRKYIVAFLGLAAVIELAQGGSRTVLFLVLIAATVLYHHTVRPISFKATVIGGSAALLLFLVLGSIRSESGFDFLSGNFSRSSEFETIMGNAVDLLYLKDAGGILSGDPEFFLGDFGLLVPQQLLPFEKTTASLWYLNRYYPETLAAGGGLAFGVVSEAVVGHGWLDLLWRGAIVGLVLGFAHRYATRRMNSYLGLLGYVWLFVWSYQTIRNTTFYLVQAVAYDLLVPLAAVWLLRYLVGNRGPLKKSPSVVN